MQVKVFKIWQGGSSPEVDIIILGIDLISGSMTMSSKMMWTDSPSALGISNPEEVIMIGTSLTKINDGQ